MAKARLLHIYIRPKAGRTMEDVEVVLDKALDWFRYDAGLYILYTTTQYGVWKTRLKPLVEPDGSLLLLAVDPGSSEGWMKKDFWAWMKQKEEKIEKQQGA